MKIIYFLIFLVFLTAGCTKSSEENGISKKTVQNSEKLFFPEKTPSLKNLLDGLGTLNEYKGEEYFLYCKKESYSDKNIDHLLAKLDSAIGRIKEVLGTKNLYRGFYLIIIDSREEMEKLIGQKYKGIASAEDNAAIFVYNSEIRPYFKHELFHLAAYYTWGKPQSRLLDEGGAMFSDNECLHYTNPISTINKYLYNNKMWFGLDELINNFNGKASENDMIAYLEAAYIFKHLYENYGIEKLSALWKKGFSDFEEIYGFSISKLESDIEEEMKSIQYNELNWDELMDKGCG